MIPRVLIIDDSITVRMDLKETFEGAGFETTLAATIEAAKSTIREHSFDLIILDVILPDGDGIELLQELKAAPATAKTPVLLLSTEDEVRDRVRGLRTGADDYVGKPYDAAQMLGRARALIHPRNGAQGHTQILLIDDSVTFAGELGDALTAAGLKVAIGRSGEQGLRLAANLLPDLVIVDQIMPGWDGPETIRRLRADAALRRTPCLLLTASDRREDELRAFEAGADAFLQKEAGVEVILAKVSALRRHQAAPEGEHGVTSLHAPKRILAVDDSPTFLMELCDQLRLAGYDAVAAKSGAEALELLGTQPVDGILLDLQMPGLTGQETCRQIKANPGWRDIPLIILTAMEENVAMAEGLHAGADDYITKSGDFAILKARLHAQLRRRQFEDENRRIHEQLHRRELEAIELQAVKEVAETRAALVARLEEKNSALLTANEQLRAAKEAVEFANQELEAFSYSVSHDLRAPLRHIGGFTQILLKRAAPKLDPQERRYLDNVCESTRLMAQLVDDMLGLARVTRGEICRGRVDLGALARDVLGRLHEIAPREAEPTLLIADDLIASGDAGLLRIVLENLLGNAWKFTAKTGHARIILRREPDGDALAYVVRDNGAGFDMKHAERLFGVFQRLHTAAEFPGTGVGLATVARVIRRHGGTIRAEGKPGEGAAFFFTLGADGERIG